MEDKHNTNNFIQNIFITIIKLTAIGFQGTVECWSCNIAIQHRQIPQCQDLTFHCHH